MKTMREFYNAIINEETITNEMREYAERQLMQMDATNEKRKEKAAIKAKEKEPRIRQVADMLTAEPKTATVIAAELTELEGAEVKVQAASALLRQAVAKGWACVQDVKVPKKGTQKGYTAVQYRFPERRGPNGPLFFYVFFYVSSTFFQRQTAVGSGRTQKKKQLYTYTNTYTNTFSYILTTFLVYFLVFLYVFQLFFLIFIKKICFLLKFSAGTFSSIFILFRTFSYSFILFYSCSARLPVTVPY